MKIKQFTFNKMRENCFVVWDEADGTAAVVDPGCADAQEQQALAGFLAQAGACLRAVLATHPHFDHVVGAGWLCRTYGLACHVCAPDRPLTAKLGELAKLYDFPLEAMDIPFLFFEEAPQTLRFGSLEVQVLPLTGHTPGSVAYYFPAAEAVCVGDTVTKGSLGFLETGFGQTLERIRDYLLPLPDGTLLCPGHGACSTIGAEREENRFFRRSQALG